MREEEDAEVVEMVGWDGCKPEEPLIMVGCPNAQVYGRMRDWGIGGLGEQTS
jgi:hypothetical protein